MMNGKKGILLVNLGTPDTPRRAAVYRYLKQFLTDRRVIDYPWLARNLLVRGIIAPFRSKSSSKLYQQLWTPEGSPLKVYGEKLVNGVQEALGKDYVVELGMRYQSPSIESAIDRLYAQQVSSLTVVPLFPQYASATVGSVHEEVMRILRKKEVIPPLQLVNSFHDFPPMVEVFASNAEQFDLDSYDQILFSYHGIPQRQLRKADACGHCLQAENCCSSLLSNNQFCYSAQCHATTRAIAKRLKLRPDQYTTTFQSRLGPEQWTKPYTIKTIEDLAEKGAKRLLVFSPAFVSDCLETTIEIGLEYQEEFTKMGGERIDLVPSLNDHPRWIEGMANLVRMHLPTN